MAAAAAAAGGGGEGAASWATGAGATGVGPGETAGGVTFVRLLVVQKTTAIATRMTPPSKADNQRDMLPPSSRSELSRMMGDPHPSVESVRRAVAWRDIRRRQSVMARAHDARRASLDAPRRRRPKTQLGPASRMGPAPFGGPSPAHPVVSPIAQPGARRGGISFFGSFGSGSGAAFIFCGDGAQP